MELSDGTVIAASNSSTVPANTVCQSCGGWCGWTAHPEPPAAPAELRWAIDPATIRDGLAVGAEVFGGSVAPDEWIENESKRAAVDIPAGKGGIMVAYVGGVPVATGSITVTDDGVARLWFGAVVESARGQGFYRAVPACPTPPVMERRWRWSKAVSRPRGRSCGGSASRPTVRN